MIDFLDQGSVRGRCFIRRRGIMSRFQIERIGIAVDVSQGLIDIDRIVIAQPVAEKFFRHTQDQTSGAQAHRDQVGKPLLIRIRMHLFLQAPGGNPPHFRRQFFPVRH
ncbi:hypothetical protein SDC9_121642 [bioreactor metagenome]|uniref:Uncharacterized protein n=1 Tax=bioreactor metagenome TaxID=1076179 RepID=A0A645CCK8_9ZZZZ